MTFLACSILRFWNADRSLVAVNRLAGNEIASAKEDFYVSTSAKEAAGSAGDFEAL